MALREFPAVILDITDGDSLWVLADQGFDSWRRTKVRLRGIACRKVNRPGGPEARDFLRGLLPPRSYPPDGTCILYSYKWYKYAPGIMGDILLYNGRHATELMLEAGFAVPWDGNGHQPEPPWPIPTSAVDNGGHTWEP
jgi:endonuclease YncB( thermonuclease family)